MTDDQFDNYVKENPDVWPYCVKAADTAVSSYRKGHKEGMAVAIVGSIVVAVIADTVAPMVKEGVSKLVKKIRGRKKNN